MYSRSAVFNAIIPLLAVLPLTAHGDPGNFYVFASVGNADSDFRPSPVDVVDDDDTAVGIGAGFRLSRQLAFELGYHDFGEPVGFAGCPPEVLCIQAFSPEPVTIDGWSAAIVGSLPLSDAIDAYAKLGILAWDASARSEGLNDSGEDLLAGIGVTWHVSSRWALQLGYEQADPDITSTRLAAAYRF